MKVFCALAVLLIFHDISGSDSIETDENFEQNEEVDLRDYHYHKFGQCYRDDCPEARLSPATHKVLHETMCPRKSKRACQVYENFPRLAVWRGSDAFNYPHMVALGFYNDQLKQYDFDCGGTLISETFILTAAHCFAGPDMKELKFVRIGSNFAFSTTSMDSNRDFEVKNVIKHPDYNRRKKQNDIALVELAKSVKIGIKLRPACLYTIDDDPENLEITGYGDLDFNGKRSFRLQKANVSCVPVDKCKELYTKKYSFGIGSSQICAGDENSNTCTGDSGGPLQIRKGIIFYIVGVTSSGEACGSPYPGIYTRISSYLDWIEKIVWS